MVTKRAQTLDIEQFDYVLAFALQRSRVPASDRLKLLLSFKAGLRACEIARIRVADMVDAERRPARMITIFGSISKGGKTRDVPMHPDIRDALIEFMKCHPTAKFIALSSRKKRGRPAAMTPNALTQWFHYLYRDAGFKGASSHSGRRSFATEAVKRAPAHHGSIVTVQKWLGHSKLETTAAYVEASNDLIGLVNALYD